MALRVCLVASALYLSMASMTLAEQTGTRVFKVSAYAETSTAQTLDDAADDAEIWLNSTDPAQSRILATDKKKGLMVLDIKGQQLDFLDVGRVNNVDLREGWSSGTVLVGASNRTSRGVSVFLLDTGSGKVTHDESSFIATDLADPYGFCMYRSGRDKRLYAIVIGKDGEFRQFHLTATASGAVSAALVRKFSFGSIAEGCVADDRTGLLFVSDELRGIWKVGAEPDSGDAKQLIAAIDGVDLVADIEGLTLAPAGDNGGYLIASVQGNNSFALFSLPEVKLAARFSVAENAEKGIDEVSGTDGIALRLGNFGDGLDDGVLVVQDDENPGAPQNFKLVSWREVMDRLRTTN